MKRSDLTIVAGIAMVAIVGVFWFLVISPKRQEASDLSTKVDELSAQVDEQELLAATAEDAEQGYDANYRRLVVLGKAVPAEADTSSLLVQVQGIANDSHVAFDSVALAESAVTDASATATPPPLTPPSDPSGEAPATDEATPSAEGEAPAPEGAEATPAAATTPADPTEAAAASMPLGATVGPAGLPVMPYNLAFAGGFFQVADFMEGIDSLVTSANEGTGVKGRLMTVDGFSLVPLDPDNPGLDKDPVLNATVVVTTYLTPSSQGLVAGASPTAPPATTPAATPTAASSTTPTSTTATSTPAP